MWFLQLLFTPLVISQDKIHFRVTSVRMIVRNDQKIHIGVRNHEKVRKSQSLEIARKSGNFICRNDKFSFSHPFFTTSLKKERRRKHKMLGEGSNMVQSEGLRIPRLTVAPSYNVGPIKCCSLSSAGSVYRYVGLPTPRFLKFVPINKLELWVQRFSVTLNPIPRSDLPHEAIQRQFVSDRWD